jgi:hypothetical protein
MTSKIVKVRANESGNFSDVLNKMTYQIPADGTTYNLEASYLLWNMSVEDPSGNPNISFGQDGFPMDAVAKIKRAKVKSSVLGDIEEIQNLNILRQNLNYWQKGSNQDESRAIFGFGADPVNYSTFPDATAKNVYIWLKDIFGIGRLNALSSQSVGELTIELELDVGINPFQLVLADSYSAEFPDVDWVDCEDIDANITNVVPTDLSVLAQLKKNMKVTFRYTSNGVNNEAQKTITNVTNANFVIDSALDATNDQDNISFLFMGVGNELCNDIALNVTTVVPKDLSVLSNLSVGQLLYFDFTSNGIESVGIPKYITAITANTSFTINTTLDAGNAQTLVSFDYQNQGVIKCASYTNPNNAQAQLTQVTVNSVYIDGVQTNLPNPLPENARSTLFRDIWVGGTYNLWSVQSVAGLFGDYEEQEVTVTAINGNGQITFAPAVAVQALAVVSGIVLIPTLDYLNRPNCVYNIQQSNLVLYKMMTAGNSLQKQVFSTYKYEARQMLDGVKFDETFLLEQPTYNVYLMTPLPNKIMSNADGIDKYRFYVNDQALTDRDIDVNDSSLHVDNLIMSFTNSQDRLLNLNPDKYKYSSADNQVPMTDQEYKPLLFPSKIYQRSIGGAPNFTGMGGLSRQLRCTLQTDDGAGCDTKKLAYLYKEHFMAI